MTRKSTDPSPWGRLFNLKTDNHPSGGGESPTLTAQRTVSLPKLFSDHGDVLLDSVEEPARQALIKFRLQLRARLAGKTAVSFETMRELVEELWPLQQATRFYLLYVSCTVPELYHYLHTLPRISIPLTPFEQGFIQSIKRDCKFDVVGLDSRIINYLIATNITNLLEQKNHPHFENQVILRQLASFGSLRAFQKVVEFIEKSSCESIGEMRQFKHEVKDWYREMKAEENFGLIARFEYFSFLYCHVRTLLILQSIIYHLETRELVLSGCFAREKDKLSRDVQLDIERLGILVKNFHEKLMGYRQSLEKEFEALLHQLYANGSYTEVNFKQDGKLISDGEFKSYGERFAHWLLVYQEETYNSVQQKLQQKAINESIEEKLPGSSSSAHEVTKLVIKRLAVLDEYAIQCEHKAFSRFFDRAINQHLIKDSEEYHHYIAKIAPLMPYAVTVDVVQGRPTIAKLAVSQESTEIDPLRLCGQAVDIVVEAAPDTSIVSPGW